MTEDEPRLTWTTSTTSTADDSQMNFYRQYAELVNEPIFSSDLFTDRIKKKKELDGWDPETNQEEL